MKQEPLKMTFQIPDDLSDILATRFLIEKASQSFGLKKEVIQQIFRQEADLLEDTEK